MPSMLRFTCNMTVYIHGLVPARALHRTALLHPWHGAHCTTRTPPAGAPPAPATEARAPALPSALARAGDAPARRD